MDGLSTTIDTCRKFWFMFPPTDHNLELMKAELSQNAKLLRIGHQMEGGVVGETTGGQAVYLPAGCIHAVLTLEGGFLVSLDFTTRESVSAFGRYIAKDLHRALDEESQRNCFFSYLDCLEVALYNQRVLTASESWLTLEASLQQTASRDLEWRQAAKKCWTKFFADMESIELICPCGKAGMEESFADHMKANHLRSVMMGYGSELSGQRSRRRH